MSHGRIKWEYTNIDAEDPLSIELLNELGAEGWELTLVNRGQAVLKRSVPDLREIVTADQRSRVYENSAAGGTS